MKGKFVFLPDDGSEPVEVDMETLMGQQPKSFMDRVKALFTKPEPVVVEKAPTTPTMEFHKIDLPEIICQVLENMFSSAEWHIRGFESVEVPNYIIKVYPKYAEDEQWEAMVSLASAKGKVYDISMVELFVNYSPYAPSATGYQA